MKIQSHEIRKNMLHVTTTKGKFVYFKDQFGSKAELEEEINKRIALDEKHKQKKEFKLNKLLNELEEK